MAVSMTNSTVRAAAVLAGLALAGAAWGAQPGGAIPFKSEAGSGAAALATSGIGVLLVSLAAIGAVLYLRKRFNLNPPAPGQAKLVKVLESQRMGARTMLFVVEFGGVHHLVAQSEQGISCLAQAAPPAEEGA